MSDPSMVEIKHGWNTDGCLCGHLFPDHDITLSERIELYAAHVLATRPDAARRLRERAYATGRQVTLDYIARRSNIAPTEDAIADAVLALLNNQSEPVVMSATQARLNAAPDLLAQVTDTVAHPERAVSRRRRVMKANRKQVHAVMKLLGCSGPIVSQGFDNGKEFCTEHGSANDTGYGWHSRGCGWAVRIADRVVKASSYTRRVHVHKLQDKSEHKDQVERLQTTAGINRALRGRLLAEIAKISNAVRADYYHDLHSGIETRSIRLREIANALNNLSETVARAEDSTLSQPLDRGRAFHHPALLRGDASGAALLGLRLAIDLTAPSELTKKGTDDE